MKWKKIGKIYCASGEKKWMMHAAMCPVAVQLSTHVFRIYFTARDEQLRGRVASLEIDMRKPLDYFNLTLNPLLDLGRTGTFDDSGVVTSSIANINGIRHLYYMGMSLGKTVPFYVWPGLAKENPDGTFTRVLECPVFGRSASEPLCNASNFVLSDNGHYRMWYLSIRYWKDAKHYYHIRHAESSDGINWIPSDIACIDFAAPTEYAIARPCVIHDPDGYKMWFCSRSLYGVDSYRIRYAESADGLHWTRKDREVGIDVSPEGWDSEMICYPDLFDYMGKRYMLYNGNGYGRTGFGLAVLEDE